MRLIGTCDFCGKIGEWEGGLWHDRGRDKEDVKQRPQNWAAAFPWNRRALPEGCNMSPESLEEHKVTTRFTCPDCVR